MRRQSCALCLGERLARVLHGGEQASAGSGGARSAVTNGLRAAGNPCAWPSCEFPTGTAPSTAAKRHDTDNVTYRDHDGVGDADAPAGAQPSGDAPQRRRMDFRPTGTDARTGLFPTLKRTVLEFREDGMTDWAAALTYYGLLSLFPALIALVSIVGLFGDPVRRRES